MHYLYWKNSNNKTITNIMLNKSGLIFDSLLHCSYFTPILLVYLIKK